MKKKERDTQRKRLYRAELVLRPGSHRFRSMRETTAFAMAVWYDPNVRALIDEEQWHLMDWSNPPRIKDGRGRRHAGGCASYITLPVWSRTDHIVLHEMAHVITQRLFGKQVAGHGWQFCKVFHLLVWVILGEKVARVLMASYEFHGIRHDPPGHLTRRAPRQDQAAASQSG